ncbi:hypothetical protein FA15DRAFT_701152 [Coprinopsis marcescibilis]|uniref:Uncharacterized protein n=1 Tax=Coprinopsis marcescibilis TaxID=230819 RepID=A0A5C3L649_COPMA|nr:hypothetical protein FA15DRAFT_701152 [Coprinopsis marcescibilis]
MSPDLMVYLCASIYKPTLKRGRRGGKDASPSTRGTNTTTLEQLFPDLFSVFAFALWAAIIFQQDHPWFGRGGQPFSWRGWKGAPGGLPVNPNPTDAAADDFSRVLVEEAVRGVGERNEL